MGGGFYDPGQGGGGYKTTQKFGKRSCNPIPRPLIHATPRAVYSDKMVEMISLKIVEMFISLGDTGHHFWSLFSGVMRTRETMLPATTTSNSATFTMRRSATKPIVGVMTWASLWFKKTTDILSISFGPVKPWCWKLLSGLSFLCEAALRKIGWSFLDVFKML